MSARILIVDDDPLVPRTLRILLRKHGYDVERAASAERGPHAPGRSRRSTSSITDINMPGADGFELLRAGQAPPPRAPR